MPIGSTFSIEQTIMQLSARSRTTSISNSFQPSNDSSTNTSVVGEARNPPSTSEANSSRLYAMPPPVPPRVKLGRMIVGNPTASSASKAVSILLTSRERGHSRPIFSIASRNFRRSSALSMISPRAAIISTPSSASTPWRSSFRAVLRPV